MKVIQAKSLARDFTNINKHSRDKRSEGIHDRYKILWYGYSFLPTEQVEYSTVLGSSTAKTGEKAVANRDENALYYGVCLVMSRLNVRIFEDKAISEFFSCRIVF